MTLDQWRRQFLSEIHAAGGVRRMADRLGVSPAYVSDVSRGQRFPGPKILAPLGYHMDKRVRRHVVVLERKRP